MIHKVIVPQERTINISFNVPEIYVGKEIQLFAFLKDEYSELQETDGNLSPALAGTPLNNQEFINWIQEAEKTDTITLTQAKLKWANKKDQLIQLSK